MTEDSPDPVRVESFLEAKSLCKYLAEQMCDTVNSDVLKNCVTPGYVRLRDGLIQAKAEDYSVYWIELLQKLWNDCSEVRRSIEFTFFIKSLN